MKNFINDVKNFSIFLLPILTFIFFLASFYVWKTDLSGIEYYQQGVWWNSIDEIVKIWNDSSGVSQILFGIWAGTVLFLCLLGLLPGNIDDDLGFIVLLWIGLILGYFISPFLVFSVDLHSVDVYGPAMMMLVQDCLVVGMAVNALSTVVYVLRRVFH